MLDNSNIWIDNPILLSSLRKDNYDKFVQNLFDYSSLINSTNVQGESLLHYCCFYGMIDKYYALTHMGAEIKLTSHNDNLLHYATLGGRDDFLIVELIKSGISPIQYNSRRQSSLHYCQNERICHYLNLWCLRNNVKIENILDNEGNTVLHTSHGLGHTLSAQYWLKNYPEMENIKNTKGLYYHEVNYLRDIGSICPFNNT